MSASLSLQDVRLATQQYPITRKEKATCGSARYITLNFGDPVTPGASTTSGQSNFLSVDKVQPVTLDSGTVLQTAGDTWTVEAPPGSVAYCVGRAAAYHMSFLITVGELPQ